ncbi:transmembrane channel-like protein 7 isoform X2 [Saccostrea echinata]|uniref:transmembrane channel-like protein 7 isoform X2 n=1 Tax=Saccostrea echinata TaxID=191078 RepID=UPI002A8224E3|nr:transmembrane channel-like protein 7 isoform X2 [Saccostrea echinata]
MTRNRVSPIGEKIDGFGQYYDDTLHSISAVKVDIPDDNGNQIKKNPIIENVKDSGLRRRRRSRTKSAHRARNGQETGSNGSDTDDDNIDEKNDLRARIENKKGPGHWTPYLHQRREKLLQKELKKSSGCCGSGNSNRQNWRKFKIWKKEMSYKLEPWGSWLKNVEGHQGTGVVSYFVFLRWLFFLNLFIFLVMLLFVTIPFAAFSNYGYSYAVQGEGISGLDVASAGTCTPLYTVNVSSDAATLIQDFLQGSGWMEKTAMFYGFYESQDLTIGSVGDHRYNYVMPLAYLLTSMVVLLFSLITMARYTMQSFRENLEDRNEKHQYCNRVFGGWDYALSEEGTALLKHRSLYKDLVGELAEQRHLEARKNMNSNQKCKLYTLRFFINFLVVCILGGSGYLIYWVTAWVTEFLAEPNSRTDNDNFVILLVEFLPSLTITALNGIVPLIFGIVVKAEDYTPEFTIKITLIRTVFLRLASLAVLIATIYRSVSCSDKDTTCNVGQNSCDELRCWETYVGQNFYKLIVLDYLVKIGVTLGYELPRKILTTKCEASICKKVGPAEFDIPKNVLDIVYTQTLCWLGFFYAPLVPALATISLFTLFYLKYLSAMYNTNPPETPYKASKSNNFFMIVLMAAFFLCCLPVGYTMVKLTPSKGCGPFRIYSYMTVIIDATISNFPSWLQTLVGIFTSGSFIIILVVLLSLVIYYTSSRSSARAAMIVMLKEQMIMEGKDKQFLLNRIYELTGEKPGSKKRESKPPPSPGPPPAVKTVNEVNPKNGSVPTDSDDIETEQKILNLELRPKGDVPESVAYNDPDNSTRKSAETTLQREITPVDWDQVSGEQDTTRTKSTVTASKVAFDF